MAYSKPRKGDTRVTGPLSQSETMWRVEWYGPDADGHKRFAQHNYTDRKRMVAAVTELLLRPEIEQLSVVDLQASQCQDCGGIRPNCECAEY